MLDKIEKIFDKFCDDWHKFYDGMYIGLFGESNNRKIDKRSEEIRIGREKALPEIEKETDPLTKTILINVAGMTNKHYRESTQVREYINNIRDKAPQDNIAVHKRIREIIGEKEVK